MLNVKIGQDNLGNYFNGIDYEEHVVIDPLRGEAYIADGIKYKSYKKLLCSDDEILQQAYGMGIINSELFIQLTSIIDFKFVE